MCRGPPNAAPPHAALRASPMRGARRVRLDVRLSLRSTARYAAMRVFRRFRRALASLRFSLPRAHAHGGESNLARPARRHATAGLLAAAEHRGTESLHHPPHRHNGINAHPTAASRPCSGFAAASASRIRIPPLSGTCALVTPDSPHRDLFVRQLSALPANTRCLQQTVEPDRRQLLLSTRTASGRPA